MSNSRPGVDFNAASGLLDSLDLEGDRHLVADHRAARFQRQVDVDTEVLTVQHHRCLEAGDLTVAHARVDAVEVQVERDRPGHALEGELTAEHIVVAVRLHRAGGECRNGVLLDVEEVGRLNVSVALVVAGVDGIHPDLGMHRRRAVLGNHDRAAEVVELAADLADHQMAYPEVDRGVHRVDCPRAGGELCGCGCSHVCASLLFGATACPAPSRGCNRTVVRFIPCYSGGG